MMIDFIIVGQGLAGSILGYLLDRRGYKVKVVDSGCPTNSSRVAGGIFNPITGKRLVKSWKADQLFPFMFDFYQQLEHALGLNFFYPTGVYKPFASKEEEEYWVIKSNERFGDWISLKDKNNNEILRHFKNFCSGIDILNSGYVNVTALLDGLKDFFLKRNILIEQQFDITGLAVSEDVVEWNCICAKKVIFCEGSNAINNPYFNWLPFVLTKGEIIKIKVNRYNINKVVNKGIYLIPSDNGIKAGATYNWDFNNDLPTDEGKEELKLKLDSILKEDYQIISHEAGIRPTVKDRKPLIGLHPEFKSLAIFNGLGTKGVSIAPYFANEFILFLENNKTLDEDVNIERFYTLYYHNSEI
ncbi:MAG: NAD(P)/FAD-dependent oxidoreductase [Cytophagaceae bacterium]